MMEVLKPLTLVSLSVFFAFNMGASGIAPSFSAVYGAKLISRRRLAILFAVFVILGALLLGGGVVKTLSSGLLTKSYFTFDVALKIIAGAALSLFIANLLGVPQSTSWATVFAIVGAALYFNQLNMATLMHMIILWLVLPILSFIITFVLFKIIYPPRQSNMWFYVKVHLWKKPIHILAIAASCYVAFAIGTNNVANAVGPLAGADIVNTYWGLILIAPLFGLGGWLVGDRTIKTIGREIVPLGLITSTLVALVTANLLIVASYLGLPQSLVQLNAFSIMAIGTIKHEHVLAIKQFTVRKILLVWLIAPIVSLAITYTLLRVWH